MTSATRGVAVPVARRPDEVSALDWMALSDLNDYILDRVEYDHARVGDGIRRADWYQRPTATLARGRGVCRDYAWLFEALAREAGYTVRSVTSEQLDHAWNEVLLAGRWWIVDVTWNDGGQFTDGTPLPDSVRNDSDFRKRYFLTTVDQEEARQRADLLPKTHRAPDVSPVDYEKTMEAMAVTEQIEELLARRRVVRQDRWDVGSRFNAMIADRNDLVRTFNKLLDAGLSARPERDRLGADIDRLDEELKPLRDQIEHHSAIAADLDQRIATLYADYQALATAHPISFEYELSTE